MSTTMVKLVFAVGLFVAALASGVQAMAPPPANSCVRSGNTCIDVSCSGECIPGSSSRCLCVL
jgi:hypothetical protein